jgi:hypothetical protein
MTTRTAIRIITAITAVSYVMTMKKDTRRTGVESIPAPKVVPGQKQSAAAQTKTALALWGAASATPPGGFKAPWDKIAAELFERLLGEPLDPRVAALGYAACISGLRRSSPRLHAILAEVRGLALAVAPEEGVTAPGEPLVYEEVLPF